MRAIKKVDLENINYYQTPKWLFDLLLEGKITPGAYSTYILMYDRIRLSSKNGWIDKDGDVYIKYSYEEMLSDLKLNSKTQIQRNLSKLLELGLIEKKRNFSSSTTYYLNIYSSTQNVVDSSTQNVVDSSTQNVVDSSTQNVETSKNNINKNNINKNNISNSATDKQKKFNEELQTFKSELSMMIREKNFKITAEELLKISGGDFEIIKKQFKNFGDKGLRYLISSIKNNYETPIDTKKTKIENHDKGWW
ncbi:replication initiator protein A [uncultured Clostridium sp.]|uniref:replication initiator protein A n=1 Tax=uncultured Clostridium sp. TaxID=59620 RepID=UPI0026064461|nr:replication initiator protein A [uncultured Clostridium sp.]